MGAARFANAALWGGALLALLGAGFASPWSSPLANPSQRAAMITTSLLALSACLGLCTRLPLSARISIAMSLVTLLMGLYGAEVFLRWRIVSQVQRAANRLGRSFDPRNRLEVLRDLRREGKEAWPVMFVGPLVQGNEELPLLPLAGISGVLTVHCNEIGTPLVYPSDQHGFLNPPGMWGPAPLDVALLGDSFAQGNCVSEEENAAARIRREFPRTLNLGIEAFGPLLELAALREYLPSLRPRRVVWLYDEGDDLTADLNHEKARGRLLEYLEPDRVQHLAARQPEVDRFWKAKFSELTARRRDSESALDRWKSTLVSWLRLRTLRGRVGLQASPPRPDFAGVDLDLFRRILESARDATHGWGGEFYFAYLPAEASVRGRSSAGQEALRDSVLQTVRELGIPSIDLLPVLQSAKDTDSLYAFPGAHLTPKGYGLLGDGIAMGLKEPE
ncbi:MAG TPA: hypothetical protein VFW45_06280 [Candidatus Polarisedimenticolia bacterium]|nr:hypothetical protein [Candidatus Polarisedimenticolia bacterium]